MTADRLLAVYEEITDNKDFRSQFEQYSHVVYFVFLCNSQDTERKICTELDFDMVEAQWVEVHKISESLLHPSIIGSRLFGLLESKLRFFSAPNMWSNCSPINYRDAYTK